MSVDCFDRRPDGHLGLLMDDGLLSTQQGLSVPTNGGLLLFGETRDEHFPDAWIQAGRFAGTDRSRIADRIEIHDQ